MSALPPLPQLLLSNDAAPSSRPCACQDTAHLTVLIEDTEFNIAVRSCRRHDHLHFPFLSFPILLNFARSILLCTAFDSPMTTPVSWPPPRQTMAAPTSSLFFVCGRPTDKRQTEPTNRHSSSCSVSRFVHFPSLRLSPFTSRIPSCYHLRCARQRTLHSTSHLRALGPSRVWPPIPFSLALSNSNSDE